MLARLLAVFNVLRKGAEVANPTAWKNGAITVNAIAALLAATLALARAF